MKRYRITLDVLTDVPEKQLEKAIRGLQKSGKVQVKFYSSELRHDPGRPAGQREKIFALLAKAKAPMSIRKINRKTQVPSITVWRNVKRGVERGDVIEEYSDQWHCMMYSLSPEFVAAQAVPLGFASGTATTTIQGKDGDVDVDVEEGRENG
jgi:hypothetical protein